MEQGLNSKLYWENDDLGKFHIYICICIYTYICIYIHIYMFIIFHTLNPNPKFNLNYDIAHTVSLVPTSAVSGEGVPDLLYMLITLTQVYMDIYMYLHMYIYTCVYTLVCIYVYICA
jgi:hypothetical protein